MKPGRQSSCRIWSLLVVLMISGCTVTPGPVAVGTKAAPDPEPRPGWRLPTPADPGDRTYLGLDGAGDFALADIRAEVLIIEVFDLYCPHCQREAPNVNRLYRRIADDPSLADRVKLIGIGVGNTTYEVNLFRKTFAIPFPLFADRSRQLARYLETRQTPTFVGFARGPDGTLQRILHAPGPIGDVEAFLVRVLELAYVDNRPS